MEVSEVITENSTERTIPTSLFFSYVNIHTSKFKASHFSWWIKSTNPYYKFTAAQWYSGYRCRLTAKEFPVWILIQLDAIVQTFSGSLLFTNKHCIRTFSSQCFSYFCIYHVLETSSAYPLNHSESYGGSPVVFSHQLNRTFSGVLGRSLDKLWKSPKPLNLNLRFDLQPQ